MALIRPVHNVHDGHARLIEFYKKNDPNFLNRVRSAKDPIEKINQLNKFMMGTSSSIEKSSHQVLPKGDGQKLQPYHGKPVLYHFININAHIDVNTSFSFLHSNVSFTTTRIESYYPLLMQLYARGYRMLTFVGMPGSVQTFGFTAMGHAEITIKYQGVFRKVPEEEMSLDYELRVDKSVLVNELFQSSGGPGLFDTHPVTGVSNTHHIFQTIERVTQNGGRLICIEVTGMMMDQQQTQNTKFSLRNYSSITNIPVDVFYEVPTHRSAKQYTYQILSVPVHTLVSPGLRPKLVTTCDWQGTMKQMLGTGWRLVDVFMDMSANVTQTGFMNTEVKQNSLWIFERPLSSKDDLTPKYQGTMMEVWCEISHQMHALGFTGFTMTTSTGWEPAIDSMGKEGWELVKILATSESKIKGIFQPTVKIKYMIFFQRKI